MPGGASCRTGTHCGRRMAAARRSGKEPSAQRQRQRRRRRTASRSREVTRLVESAAAAASGTAAAAAAAATAAAQVAVAVSRYSSDSRAQSSTHHTSGISRFLSFGYSAPNFSKFHACVARARVPIPIQLKAAKAAGASEPHAMP